MRVNHKQNCINCFKPVARRLALFQPKDEYECYAEGYVKCFWGLCDHHKSNDDFARATSNSEVITVQPKREGMLFKGRTVIEEIGIRQLN